MSADAGLPGPESVSHGAPGVAWPEQAISFVPMAKRLTMLKARLSAPSARLTVSHPGSWRTSGQTSGQRGYDYRWQKARHEYLRLHPYCVYCIRETGIESTDLAGVILECAARALPVPYGNVVDHIVAHRGDKTLFWDEANWQTLCRTHHSCHKQREEALKG